MTERKALGRGLEALMSSVNPTPAVPAVLQMPHPSRINVPIDKISPNRSQPRENFDEAGLKDLAESIKSEGILQPLVVAPSSEGRYELIAGERRLRAARLAGLTEVPAVIREASADKKLELALVENIQREDLNAMEEARGYEVLCRQFNLNPADIAERVGKSREHLLNTLRLLKLPRMIQEDVAQGKISAGHARALLSLPSKEEQIVFRNRIIRETLSVRDIERMIQERGGQKKSRRPRRIHLSDQMKLIVGEMERALATRIRLQPGSKEGHGKISIDYYSWQDLDRVYKKITGHPDTPGGEGQWEKTTEAG